MENVYLEVLPNTKPSRLMRVMHPTVSLRVASIAPHTGTLSLCGVLPYCKNKVNSVTVIRIPRGTPRGIIKIQYSQMVLSRATRHFEGLSCALPSPSLRPLSSLGRLRDLELFAFRPAEAMDECTWM